MYECKECNYMTSDRSNFHKHKKSKKHILRCGTETIFDIYNLSPQEINNNKNTVICEYCNKEYSSKYTLARHKNICSNKKGEDNMDELKKQLVIKDTKLRIQAKQIKDINNELKEKLKEKDEYFKTLILNLNQTADILPRLKSWGSRLTT